MGVRRDPFVPSPSRRHVGGFEAGSLESPRRHGGRRRHGSRESRPLESIAHRGSSRVALSKGEAAAGSTPLRSRVARGLDSRVSSSEPCRGSRVSRRLRRLSRLLGSGAVARNSRCAGGERVDRPRDDAAHGGRCPRPRPDEDNDPTQNASLVQKRACRGARMSQAWFDVSRSRRGAVRWRRDFS